MNRQGPNGIGWCDATWNPLVGCLHGCKWCYARRLSERFGGDFLPREHWECLGEPAALKKPARIFVGSVSDMMGAWWSDEQIQRVIDTCAASPRHRFQWLTKRPARYAVFTWPSNCWLGATITDEFDGADTACEMRHVRAPVRFLSAEPLLGATLRISLCGIQWLIIGPQTGPGAHQPPREAVELLLESAHDYDVPVYMKRALVWEPRREEFPT